MASKLGCFNGALGLLTQPTLTTPNPSPSTEASRLLNDNWQSTVEWCFEQGDWDFAIERDELSRLATAPAWGYTYYYNLPADVLRIVAASESGLIDDRLLRYKVENGKVATDAATLYLAWVSSNAIDTPGKWSESFARFVAAELALRCIKLNIGSAQVIDQERKRAMKLALGVDAVQGPPSLNRPGRWARSIRGRFRNSEQAV